MLFVFATIIIIVHLCVLFSVGKLMKLDLAKLAMASAVCIGGPSSAAALASAKGWRDLLIAGSFGYAISSFVGITDALKNLQGRSQIRDCQLLQRFTRGR